MPYSHHSHSGQFCRHAKGSLDQVVLEAIAQGFETYGLTEHVPRYRIQDLYPEETSMSIDSLTSQFDAFLVEAHRLKTHYASRITLLVGLETDFITERDLIGLSDILQKYGDRIEYLVGSIHHVSGIPIDFDIPTFNNSFQSFAASCPTSDRPPSTASPDVELAMKSAATMTSFLCAYFDAQYELILRFHPEVIGHFDLCRLYSPSLRFGDYPEVIARIQRNVKYAIDYGALFELNAAAFRKGWDTAYPGEDVVQIILEAGGRFALSDDSHGPSAVGLNYDKLLKYAHRVGVAELWVLQSSESPNTGGRKTASRRVSGDWREHRFWRRPTA